MINDLLRKVLDDEQMDPFAQWAFGPDYIDLSFIKLAASWNKKHSELYRIDYSNSLKSDLVKMIELWKLEHERSS